MHSRFQFAYNVRDLDDARRFYGDVLGCREGRSAPAWIDFFGHEISLHLGKPFRTERTGRVGDHLVPMPHLGVALQLDDWKALAERLRECDVNFALAPTLRSEGQLSEQWPIFFFDPSGNPIEIKGLSTLDALFQAA